jgi:hypothetical protein
VSATRLPITLCVLVISILLTGCITFRAGRQLQGGPIQGGDGYQLGVVEIDDQGRFWNRSEVEQVIGLVRQETSKGGATVVVFIHGWHHSARPDDENLTMFRDALRKLKTEMDEPIYRAARKKLFKHEDAEVIGVYVGWRGRSLPSFLDYLTFWGRKAAAERVGQGDVVELLSALHNIWSEANDRGKYTGLVTIGHSFGGQVALSAVSGILRNRVVVAQPDGSRAFKALAGFGDLVVLVNPAVESALFEAISEQTRKATFAKQQTPVLLVVSSETDGANGSWFPFGRRIGVINQLHRESEYEQNIRALGWYKPQVTHCLAAEGGRQCAGVTQRPLQYRGPRLSLSTTPRSQKEYFGVWTEADLKTPEDIELGADIGMVATRFYRVSDGIDPNLPFVVARATSDIEDGHSDMFNPRFTDFLIRYVAGAELKRFILLARSQAAAAPP